MKTTLTGTLVEHRQFKSHRGSGLLTLMKDALLPARYYPPRYWVETLPTPESPRGLIVTLVGRNLEAKLHGFKDAGVSVTGTFTPWGNTLGGDLRRWSIVAVQNETQSNDSSQGDKRP